jgi:hypothetical protein
MIHQLGFGGCQRIMGINTIPGCNNVRTLEVVLEALTSAMVLQFTRSISLE